MGADSEQGKKELIKDFCIEAHKLAGAEQNKGVGALGYYAARDLGTKCYDAGFQAGVESGKKELLDTAELLREFLHSEDIAHYDSSVCWGCGHTKKQVCPTYCLLDRTRNLLASLSLQGRKQSQPSVPEATK